MKKGSDSILVKKGLKKGSKMNSGDTILNCATKGS
jgi:hypothetical protein